MSDEFIKAEMALFAEQAEEVDIIITTALIPGTSGTKTDYRRDGGCDEARQCDCRSGLGAGGNCELTEPGKVAVHHDVSIIGYTDLPSRMAKVSSDLYASNLTHLMNDLTPGEGWSAQR